MSGTESYHPGWSWTHTHVSCRKKGKICCSLQPRPSGCCSNRLHFRKQVQTDIADGSPPCPHLPVSRTPLGHGNGVILPSPPTSKRFIYGPENDGTTRSNQTPWTMTGEEFCLFTGKSLALCGKTHKAPIGTQELWEISTLNVRGAWRN